VRSLDRAVGDPMRHSRAVPATDAGVERREHPDGDAVRGVTVGSRSPGVRRPGVQSDGCTNVRRNTALAAERNVVRRQGTVCW